MHRAQTLSRLPSLTLPRIDRTTLRREAQRWLLMVLGAAIAAFAYTVFQVPHNLAAGGLSGLSIIIHHYTGWPIGLLFFVLTLPLLILGFFHLGRWHFLVRTLFAALAFAVLTEVFLEYLPGLLPVYPLTDDVLLSAIYAGIVGGLGLGLIFRAGSTVGSTGIINRIIQKKTGVPLSQVYFYTDGLIIVLAGLVFGWNVALYAFLLLFISGMATDYVLEGPSRTRTATVITERPQAVITALQEKLERGVSYWEVTGGYSGRPRTLVMCTVSRSQLGGVKRAIAEADPQAFVTIGVGHLALGGGFAPLADGKESPAAAQPAAMAVSNLAAGNGQAQVVRESGTPV